MRGHNLWSYAPYKPLLHHVGDIYICRVVPYENAVHFEWLDIGVEEYAVFCRRRNTGEFILAGRTVGTSFTLENLETDTDFEFYVQSGDKKSRIRLARTGQSIGTVVNYLHPDDEAYSFSGRYLCTPSLVRHPDGFLLASMDLHEGQGPQNLTLIFRSDDDGETWYYVSELMPCFWGNLFIHNGELYMLSCSTEYGDLLIGKSTDGGKTFSAPVSLLRGSNGKKGNVGVHKSAPNVLKHNGRLYTTVEWGAWANREYCHAAMVISCDINDDLLIPENWSFTPPKKFDPADAPELSHLSACTMTIEGTAVVDKNGNLLDILRFGGDRCVIAYEADLHDPEAPLTYSRCIPFPANLSKFVIQYDTISGKYYSIASRLPETSNATYACNPRNLLSLFVSDDLDHWHTALDLIDYSHRDPLEFGFQYVYFEIEANDILYVCRTAMNGAHNFHDSNYTTFHRIKNFRNLSSSQPKEEPVL